MMELLQATINVLGLAAAIFLTYAVFDLKKKIECLQQEMYDTKVFEKYNGESAAKVLDKLADSETTRG